MNLLNAPALLFALIAIPIVLLYLLRLRRREQTVSSTLLWRQAVLDREANTLWQRLRRNLLLLLQLITLAFLVFALTRPYVETPGGVRGRHIVLLDASASMQATDTPPSRFEVARARAREMIEQLGPGDTLSIILVDHAPRALTGATDNKAELLDALAAAQPSLRAANWSAAIALAQAIAGSASPIITVISDGAGDSAAGPANGSPASPLSLLGDTARFIPIGTSGDNLAITTLSLRRTLQGLAALVRVENMGSQPREALVSLRVDGALADARTLVVPAGQSVAWTVNGLDLRAASVQASLQAGAGNALAIDDTAYAVNTVRNTRRALLLSRGNVFLEQALAALPELEVTRAMTPPVLPDAGLLLAAGRDFGFDLFILDGLSMTLPAEASVLYVGAAAPFTVTGQFSNTDYVRAEAHPILEAVDWRPVNILSAALLDAPGWLKPVVQTQGGPALYAGQRSETPGGGRVVVIPFDLRRSDLPLQIAFPVLIANTVEWLAPAQGASIPASVRPGEAVALPPNSVVQLPNGSVVTVGERGFADTEQPGIYQALVSGARAPIRSDFAVNFFNPAESNIAPNLPALAGRADPARVDGAETATAQREIWPWLAALALVALMAEWWVYQRGLPTIKLTRATRSSKP